MVSYTSSTGPGAFTLRLGESVLFGPVKSDVKYWFASSAMPAREDQLKQAFGSANHWYGFNPWAFKGSMTTPPDTRPPFMSRYLWTNQRVLTLRWNVEVVEQEMLWTDIVSVSLQVRPPLPYNPSYGPEFAASREGVGDVVFAPKIGPPLIFGMIQFATDVHGHAQAALNAYSGISAPPSRKDVSMQAPVNPLGRDTGLVLELQPLSSMVRDPSYGWTMNCPACHATSATLCSTCRGLGRFQPSPLAQRAQTDRSVGRMLFYGRHLDAAAQEDALRRARFTPEGICMDCNGTGKSLCLTCRGANRIILPTSIDRLGRYVISGSEPLPEARGRFLVDADGYAGEWCACAGTGKRVCTWCGGKGNGVMLGCAKCNGSGVLPCIACDNSGVFRMIVYHGERWLRPRKGKEWLCADCYGEGREGWVDSHPNRRCRVCGGSGLAPEPLSGGGGQLYTRTVIVERTPSGDKVVKTPLMWKRTNDCRLCGGTGSELCTRCSRQPPPPPPPTELVGCAYKGAGWEFSWAALTAQYPSP
jgi:hypothetical protein